MFRRNTNKKGKPVGKAVLTGFSFNFDDALDASIAANPANYEVDSTTIKVVKRKRESILEPITNFTVSYNAVGDEATISFTGKETFPNGGQIAVLNSVTDGSGATLAGFTIFKITDGGKRITPA